MSGRRARKAKPSNVLTADDVVVWKRLISRARAIADQPTADALKFVTAAEKAGGCCAPDGHRHVDSPFTALVRLGRRFLLIALSDRAAHASEIRTWCGAMEAALETAIVGSRKPKAAPASAYRHPYADNDQ